MAVPLFIAFLPGLNKFGFGMCVVARFYIKPLLALLVAGACDDLLQVGGESFVRLVGFIGGGQGVLVQVCADEAKKTIRFFWEGSNPSSSLPLALSNTRFR